MPDTTTPVRLAIRRLRRDRAFSLAVVASLALGVGVNVTMLATVDALLFRPPPQVRDVDRVVRIESPTFESSTYPDYVDLRNESRALAGLAVYAPRRLSAMIEGAPLVLPTLLTSHSYFPLLGVHAARGRFYTADEDRRGASHTAVISHDLWRRQWNGREDVIGVSLRIGGEIFTVIGVAPSGFTGTETAPVDLFLPIESSLSASDAVGLTDRGWSWVRILGRLAPGASTRQAASEATTIFRRSNSALPGADRDEVARATLQVTALMDRRWVKRDGTASVSLWVAATAAIVLLIACINVASLCLARSARQARTAAVQLALGGTRWRLARERLLEISLLALAGGIGGTILAWWGGGALRSLLLARALANPFTIDARSLALSAASIVVTLVVAGLGPTLVLPRLRVVDLLRQGSRSATTTVGTLRRALLGAQLAFVCVLLIGAGLFAQSLRQVERVPLGIVRGELVTTPINLYAAGLAPKDLDRVTTRLRERVAAIPGVRGTSAGMGTTFLGQITFGLRVPGRDSLPGARRLEYVPMEAVTPGLFRVAGIALSSGRLFTDGDIAARRRVVVLSQSLAAAYWPNESPIGACTHAGNDSIVCTEVIGVVADRRSPPPDTAAIAEYYLPLGSPSVPTVPEGAFSLRFLLTRVSGDAATVRRAIDRIVAEELPQLGLVESRSLDDWLEPWYRSWRVGTILFGIFGALAMLLGLVGVYSVVSMQVTDRHREFGIRLALGAAPSGLARLVLNSVLRLAVVSLAAAIVIALLTGRHLGPLLFGTRVESPFIYAGAGIALALGSVLASLPAVRQAVRLDPVQTLRAE